MNKKVIDKDEVVDNIDNSIYDIKDNCKLVINVDNSINSSTFNLGNNSEFFYIFVSEHISESVFALSSYEIW